jgi:putative colanic acid biosysnthesis UDP-glucose lipid carrier transferase
MFKKYNIIIKPFFLIIDILIIIISYFLGWWLRIGHEYQTSICNEFFNPFFNKYGSILFISIVSWSIISLSLNLQHVPRRSHSSQFWKYFVYPQVIQIFILLFSIVFSNLDFIPRLFLVYFISLQFFGLWISRKIRKIIIIKMRGLGYNFVRLAIIGDQNIIDMTKNWVNKNPESGFYFSNHFDFKPSNFNNSKDYALSIIELLNTGDYVLIQSKFLNKKELIEIIDLAEDLGAYIFHIIDIETIGSLETNRRMLGPHYIINSRYEPLKSGMNIINKRIFDVIFSLLFLIFIYWWVYLIVGFIIKLKSPGPILFKQKRVGYKGGIFYCNKFRTMKYNSTIEKNTSNLTSVGDSRIFPFGELLRKSNIDEFPQFINVLFGEMSVVGPRPHMISEDTKLANSLSKYRIRYWVKPGITGLAAMEGYRGGTEDLNEMQNRINIDIKYIESWTFWLDIKLCWSTFTEMIVGKTKGH